MATRLSRMESPEAGFLRLSDRASAGRPLQICIVAAHFYEGRGYMENVWANVLSRRGHKVTVLASPFSAPGIWHERNEESRAPIIVRRLGCTRLPSGLCLRPKGILRELEAVNPDLILWISIGTHFGNAILRYLQGGRENCKLVCFFGENTGWHGFLPRNRKMSLHDRYKTFGWRVLRGPLYRKAIYDCDLAIATKHETAPIIESLFSQKEKERLREKLVKLPLGYDGEVFYYDEDLRAKTRAELRIEDGETVLVVSSRMARTKIRGGLAGLLQDVTELVRAQGNLRALIVGFNDSLPSQGLRQAMERTEVGAKFICHGLADRRRLNALFNAGDIAVFDNPSISVQEAMGTGLFMVLSDDGSMEHLIRAETEGVFFRKGDFSSLKAAIHRAMRYVSNAHSRAERQGANAWLDYERLADRLFDKLLERSGSEFSCY